MQLHFDSFILEWFENWLGEFEWDDGNYHKNGVTRLEIEGIFDNPIYIAGKITESIQEPRWLILGERLGKGWTLVITIRGSYLRVISCRRQRKDEKIIYEHLKNKAIH